MGIAELAANENPLGPSPRAVEAGKRAMAGSHRYPDDEGRELRKALSERLAVPVENLALGHGSTELVELATRALLRPGDEGLSSQGTFPVYETAVRSMGASFVAAPQRNHVLDLDAIAAAASARTKVIFLANPNNPTGTYFTAGEFEKFLGRIPWGALVVLDEAYFEYAERPGYSRSLDLVKSGANLFVLRTFSKIYGLAGLRIGYGVGSRWFLDEMNGVRAMFNTSRVAQAAALAALDDAEHVRRSLETNRAGLAQLVAGLEALSVPVIVSAANFILVELDREAGAAAAELEALGVMVRPMAQFGFPNAVRVTVGTREENGKFLKALSEISVPSRQPLAGHPKGKR